VLSRHPGIIIETHEGRRAEQLVQAVANDLRLPRFEWSITCGLVRAGHGQGVYQTNEPARALAAIAELQVEAIFELRDFSAYSSISRPPTTASRWVASPTSAAGSNGLGSASAARPPSSGSNRQRASCSWAFRAAANRWPQR
jgi:hypothetical protein